MDAKRSHITARRLRLLPLTVLLAVIAFLPGYAQSDYRQVNPSSATDVAQPSEVRARVTQAVDVQNLVTLQGNIHPLARAEFDRGAAPDGLPMARMLLVLRRGEDQETALRQLLDEQQVKSSPLFHQWLTPAQFGQQFGPADSDLQAVADWLTTQGFQVAKISAGRTVIEFSGTAGLVRQVLGTEIHRFRVNGEERWANVSDPQIPAALAPVVAGFASLNNFPRKPQVHRLGTFSRSKLTGEVEPLFTFLYNGGYYLAVGPTDFATIYNVLPLYASTDGTGQTIAVVGETNINLQDVADFRAMFGLPVNPPNIILNGPDPGITSTDETEADLDVEWSGAVAKGATIDLVVSEATEATSGIDLSALYIVDNNLAPVMSISYGGCEARQGAGGSVFHSTLWEQAAAQGITVVIATGDSGSAGCDYYPETAAQYGLAVSDLASTAFNVAVGGTDFNDLSSAPTYWNEHNSSPYQNSVKSYIPEIPWNDTCASSVSLTGCTPPPDTTLFSYGYDLVAGGGGPSSCTNPIGTFPATICSGGGFAKPSWQSGTGVPSDGVRDIPDLSLFAGDGYNASFYVLCQVDANASNGGSSTSCDLNSPYLDFQGAGGTSASAQAFAGIMALVNQRYGRQGNANYVLYPLAAQAGNTCVSNAAAVSKTSCIFYDITTGNNSVICQGGSPNCSNTSTASGQYGIMVSGSPASAAWTTTAGYDLATGLGSVNVANLVNKWTSVSFTPSATTLSLSTSPPTNPIALAHGQSVNFTINVTTGSGTPTGDVSLIAQADSSSSNVTGIGPFTLSGGSVSGTTNMLPGGSYNVTAHYAGNGTYGASDSNTVAVTVGKESSLTEVRLVTLSATAPPVYSLTTVSYGSPYFLRMDVTNSSGQFCANQNTGLISYPCPTGALTVSPAPTEQNPPPGTVAGSYTLNSQRYAEDQPIQQTPGTYNFVATYAGDSSYNPSPPSTAAITITKALTTTALSGLPSSVVGTNVSCTVTINTQSNGVAPTGTVQFLDNGVPLGSPLWVYGSPYSTSTGTYATAQVTFSTTLLSPGTDSITAQYSGDSNYAASTSATVTVNVTDYSMSANPSTINISAPGQSGTSTITLTPLNGFTGTINLFCVTLHLGMGCTISPSSVNIVGSSAVTATLTVTTTAQVGATVPTRQPRVPPSFRVPVGWPWLLAGLLALGTLVSLAAARRRPAGWLVATALLVVGVWAACGGGGASGPPPAPMASLSTTSLTFSQQNMGSTSASQNVTLSNTGNALLSISSIALGGTNPGDFAQTNTCASSVAAGATCAISVTFAPQATGSRSALLSITDNAGGSPHTVHLTGTALPPATSPGTYAVSVLAASGNDSHSLDSLQVNVQ